MYAIRTQEGTLPPISLITNTLTNDTTNITGAHPFNNLFLKTPIDFTLRSIQHTNFTSDTRN